MQIVVYDLTGKVIAEVVSQNFDQAITKQSGEGRDTSGNKVAQGIYIYSIRTDETDREVRGKLVSR